MSVLRRAWEGRSTWTGVDRTGSGIPPGVADPPAGYGITGGLQRGYGQWTQGMRWQSWGNGGPAGPDEAMRLSAVFACLRLLSEAISTLPIDLFRRIEGARVEYPAPSYLRFDPPAGSRITYLSQLMLSLLTNGNAFVATPRDELGVPTDLVVLDPGLVEVYRGAGNVPVYVFGDREYTIYDVMHVAGMTLPGQLRGVSPLKAAREVIVGGRKAQDYGTAFFDNNAVPPAVIEMPDAPGADAAMARRVAAAWQETNGGTSNAGKVGVLIGGAQLKTVAVAPEDAEWLDSKRFGVSEIARFYGVPPHLIADASNSTSWGSGLAEQNLAFGQFSLRPWTERIENAHARLLSSHGLVDVTLKLNLDALLRASLSDRYESYNVGIAAGFLTINEARALEDRPPVPWGDAPASGDPASPAGDARAIAELVQKIYLGVGTVLTQDEARAIANQAGAGLIGPGPVPAPATGGVQ